MKRVCAIAEAFFFLSTIHMNGSVFFGKIVFARIYLFRSNKLYRLYVIIEWVSSETAVFSCVEQKLNRVVSLVFENCYNLGDGNRVTLLISKPI